MGPTASGKTRLSLDLCRELDCEIISVDSAPVYRGMDIGTAKPNAAEQAQAVHHLIDIRDPAESYSAAEFRSDALRLMGEITARGKTPLLVGGTMLYFKALLEGIAEMPAADLVLRAEIERLAAARGWPHVHALLAEVDPDSAARIHPNHSQRIGRALEVYRASGVTMTEWHRRQSDQQSLPYGLVQLAIAPVDRQQLAQRIEQRFRQMLEQGFEQEVSALLARGDLHPDLPAIRAVGYRQMWRYLTGELDHEAMVERGIIATRQLAKRQFTWLRGWKNLHWLNIDQNGGLIDGEFCRASAYNLSGAPPIALALKYIAHSSGK